MRLSVGLPLLLLLALAPAAEAGIYRYTDADGNVVLSDTLPKHGVNSAQRIEPQSVMTVPALQAGPRRAAAAEAAEPAEPATAGYTIVIQSPGADATYRRSGDDIPIALSVSPALAAGHRLEVLLDGANADGLAVIALGETDRGSHILEARVVDKTGQVIESSAVSFHVYQHSALRQQKPRPAKKEKPKL